MNAGFCSLVILLLISAWLKPLAILAGWSNCNDDFSNPVILLGWNLNDILLNPLLPGKALFLDPSAFIALTSRSLLSYDLGLLALLEPVEKVNVKLASVKAGTSRFKGFSVLIPDGSVK